MKRSQKELFIQSIRQLVAQEPTTNHFLPDGELGRRLGYPGYIVNYMRRLASIPTYNIRRHLNGQAK